MFKKIKEKVEAKLYSGTVNIYMGNIMSLYSEDGFVLKERVQKENAKLSLFENIFDHCYKDIENNETIPSSAEAREYIEETIHYLTSDEKYVLSSPFFSKEAKSYVQKKLQCPYVDESSLKLSETITKKELKERQKTKKRSN